MTQEPERVIDDADEQSPSAPFVGEGRGKQFGKLMRILRPRPQRFRVRYVSASAAIVQEIEFTASDLSEAVQASALMPWPRLATGLRIVDSDGQDVFERLKAGGG